MRVGTFVASMGVFAGSASGGITSVDPFTGQYQESFETLGWGYKSGSTSVFNGIGSMREIGNGGLIVTSSWSFHSVVRPQDGSGIMGSPGSAMEFRFAQGGLMFGGHFATNSNAPGGFVDFFDASDQLISREVLSAPTGGQWVWNGWRSDSLFTRVRITGNYGSGGFVMQDNLQVSTVPGPGSQAIVVASACLFLRRRSRADSAR